MLVQLDIGSDQSKTYKRNLRWQPLLIRLVKFWYLRDYWWLLPIFSICRVFFTRNFCPGLWTLISRPCPCQLEPQSWVMVRVVSMAVHGKTGRDAWRHSDLQILFHFSVFLILSLRWHQDLLHRLLFGELGFHRRLRICLCSRLPQRRQTWIGLQTLPEFNELCRIGLFPVTGGLNILNMKNHQFPSHL